MLVTAEHRGSLVEERLRAGRDVGERVAAEEDGDIVVLQDRRIGVAREPDCFLEHGHAATPCAGSADVERQVAL